MIIIIIIFCKPGLLTPLMVGGGKDGRVARDVAIAASSLRPDVIKKKKNRQRDERREKQKEKKVVRRLAELILATSPQEQRANLLGSR